jgi:hypothetical protein
VELLPPVILGQFKFHFRALSHFFRKLLGIKKPPVILGQFKFHFRALSHFFRKLLGIKKPPVQRTRGLTTK